MDRTRCRYCRAPVEEFRGQGIDGSKMMYVLHVKDGGRYGICFDHNRPERAEIGSPVLAQKRLV